MESGFFVEGSHGAEHILCRLCLFRRLDKPRQDSSSYSIYVAFAVKMCSCLSIRLDSFFSPC